MDIGCFNLYFKYGEEMVFCQDGGDGFLPLLTHLELVDFPVIVHFISSPFVWWNQLVILIISLSLIHLHTK